MTTIMPLNCFTHKILLIMFTNLTFDDGCRNIIYIKIVFPHSRLERLCFNISNVHLYVYVTTYDYFILRNQIIVADFINTI